MFVYTFSLFCVCQSISIGIRSKSAPLMSALLVSFLLGSAYSIDVCNSYFILQGAVS